MLTKKELPIFIEGIASIFILYALRATDWWRIALFNYCFGFVFEASMEPLFTYHKDLKTSRCMRNTDMNFLFPLGWNFAFASIAVLASLLGPGNWLTYAFSGFLIGTILEYIYFKRGFWCYNFNEKFGGFYKPFYPKITWFGGIPVQVSVSYALSVGTFVWFIMTIMFPE